MAFILPIFAIASEIVALTGAYDIALDKVMNATPDAFGLKELADPDLSSIPQVKKMMETSNGADEIVNATDDFATRAEEIANVDTWDFDQVQKNFDDTTALDEKAAANVSWIERVTSTIEAEYKQFDANKTKYILEKTAYYAGQAMKSPFVLGLIGSITVLAIFTMGRALRLVGRLTKKVFSKVKDFVKKLVARIKAWMQKLVARLKSLRTRAKANKSRTKKAREKALKRKKDLDAKIGKLDAKLKKLDFSKLRKYTDDIRQAINDKFQSTRLGLRNTVLGFGAAGGAFFLFIDETRDFIFDFFGNISNFIIDIFDNIAIIIPALISLLKSAWKLLLAGIDTTTVLLFIAPALVIFYYTTYFIQLLNRNY